MNELIWVCLALAAWPSAFGLYFEKVKDEFRPPTSLRNNSYFGYSITYDPKNALLVVSAPRTDDIGDVYDCDIGKTSCSKIDRAIISRSKENGLANYTHDFWFGATVKAGPDFVMMCAPRYTERSFRYQSKSPPKSYIGFNAIVTRGRCYKHTKGSLVENRIIDEDVRLDDSPSPMEVTMDSFGWSMDVATDDSVIVGGPGIFLGRAMIYSRPEQYKIPYLLVRSKNPPKFNFGYAVAAGKFISNDLLWYAVSSTYGKFGSGEVYFFKAKKDYPLLKTLVTKEHIPAVGSMFGAVLCAANMLGKRSDLLVGAPAYADAKDPSSYNRGAVYVYLALKASKPPAYHRIIIGEKPGSMFGSAIISVGDLNNDKKDEIAIGAPFENSGHGVVYLYSGAKIISSDIALEPMQKIKPEASYGESFGMSLTPLLDYDKNGCNEIAIGSPYTDTVVLLRCMASIIVTTSATFPNLQGRTKTRQEKFDFNVRLSVTYPTLPDKITATLITTVEMNHDHAKLDTKGTGRYVFETILDENKITKDYYKKVPFILPINGKYETEISYVISSELKTDPRSLTSFDSSRVILSDLSVLNVRDALWAAECADKTCVPNLELTTNISFKNDSHTYIIGSSITETLSFTLHNYGEVAYAPCVKLHIVGVHVFKPGGCVYESLSDGDRLTCEPSKPIRTGNNTSSGLIELEMVHLKNKDKWINITMLVYNHCNHNVTQTHTFEIPVKADPSGIMVKGATDIGSIVGMTEEDIEKNGKKLQHLYTINNNGPTNWEGLIVYVTLPMQPYINYFNSDNSTVVVLSSVSSDNTPCTYETDDTSMLFTCTVNSLIKAVESATILIPINIIPGTLKGLLDDDKNITITSSVQTELLDGKFKAESVSTTIILVDAAIPVDTIIIAVVVALCILIIIALILYRVGFLRRKRREELQKLKKSVKRQTILRRSTMPSQNNASEDRRQILEQMKEEDEIEQAPNLI